MSLRLSWDKIALGFVLTIFASLAIYRGIHLWLTGFYVSDEFSYLMVAINGEYKSRFSAGAIGFTYTKFVRPVFFYINWSFVHALVVNNGSRFAASLPFYLFSFNSVTLLSAYGILRNLSISPRAIALTLFGSVTIISFLILSQGLLTEPVSLTLAMLGAYFLVKYTKVSRTWGAVLPLMGSLAFVAASYTREPYRIFLYVSWLPVAYVAYKHYRRSGRHARDLAAFLLAPISFVLPTFVNFGQSTQQLTGYESFVSLSLEKPIVPHLGEAVLTAIGGLLVGWNPIIFVVSMIGLVALVWRTIKNRDNASVMVSFLAITALLLFLVVCFFITSTADFDFLAFGSTIIRYSHMAVMGYFLLAPFAFEKMSKKFVVIVFSSILIFAVLATPTYQTSLQSHLSYGYPYSVDKPIFSLEYRTPLAHLRDFISSHSSQRPILVYAEPDPRSYYDNFSLHWRMLPGTADLPRVDFQEYPAWSQFNAQRPGQFFLYGEGDYVPRLQANASYMLPFLDQTSQDGPRPFQVMKDEVIYRGYDSFLVLVEIQWSK